MTIQQKILNWFHIHGRKNLPWYQEKNIYLIWISEIMLQQTQVKTVIPYFNKFKKKFPNIKSLAKSSLDEILEIWTGLGYYQRAYNLKKTANIIYKKYNGTFPNNFKTIIKFPGIGKTTAHAILSFAYNFNLPILDANVKRIILRHFNLQKKKKNIQLEKKLWKLIDHITPVHNTQKFNQAIMDLGAKICKNKNPLCNSCPINFTCITFKNNKHIVLQKKIKKKIQKKGIIFLIFYYKKYFFLIKNTKKKIWKNLFSFPILNFSYKHYKKKIFKEKNYYFYNKKIPPFIHVINYKKIYFYPFFTKIYNFCYIIKKFNTSKKIWYNLYHPPKIGLSVPMRKIIKKMKKIYDRKKNEKKK